jgi:hypothetical protein
MFERGITEVDVREVLENGKVIEKNPKDLPYPSYTGARFSFKTADSCGSLG